VNEVFLVDKGPIDGSTGAFQPLWMVHVPYTFCRMGDQSCLEISYVSMLCVLLSCLWSCVSVLVAMMMSWRHVATSGAGFDELKFQELGLIHHRLLLGLFTMVGDD
jgi:hypothetical protein